MRVLLAGIAGGIVMFIWSSIAHVATPLGHVGISALPDQQATIAALQSTIGDKGGLYLFPAPPKPGAAMPSGMGAAGFLVWRPQTAMSMNPKTLGTEFLTEFAEALIAAALLAWSAISSYGARVCFVGLVGLAGAITTNISYWNWYGFPANYTLVYGLVEFVGYIVAGLVIALILPSTRTEGAGLN